MSVLKELQFCRKCGAILGKRIDKLARSCLPPTLAGISNIKRIKRGKLPTGVSRWPCDPLCLPTIAEEVVNDHYIKPGLDVFQQPRHSPNIIHQITIQIDAIRQRNRDTRKRDRLELAASSSVQAQDCRAASLNIPRRTDPDDDDSSSD